MSYFTRVPGYKTARGKQDEANFRFAYNSNSGGGQSFLAGKYRDENGIVREAITLNGRNAIFGFEVNAEDSVRVAVLDGEEYPITPRGGESTSMKLSVGNGNRPSTVISMALMLPKTSAIKAPYSLAASPLTVENYWLQMAHLEYRPYAGNGALFIPTDMIFAGGFNKNGEGTQEFFSFDFNRRIKDIIRASEIRTRLGGSATDIANALAYFSDFYTGEEAFSYKTASSHVENCMRNLAELYPDYYSGISDPLPLIMRVLGMDDGLSTAQLQPATTSLDLPHNLIYFGAPGTGKSYTMNKDAKMAFGSDGFTRVTFHPDYTYAQFVGGFRPYSRKVTRSDGAPALDEDGNQKERVGYRYVPGPFIDAYVKAVSNPDRNVALLVEEINRANPASVFGDVFQLLDRDGTGRSEYSVVASEELSDYLHDLLDDKAPLADGRVSLSLPPNLFLWASMNSADQGVYPMDTAFRRRWDFQYIGVDAGEDEFRDVVVSTADRPRGVRWNDLRKAINKLLMDTRHVNEDKLMGAFFVRESDLTAERFPAAFKDKVLMYLYEDAAKAHRDMVFRDGRTATYSQLCDRFDAEGLNGVFTDKLQVPDASMDFVTAPAASITQDIETATDDDDVTGI